MLCDDLEGWDGGGRDIQVGGHVLICMMYTYICNMYVRCIIMADSRCCTAETNMSL